MRSAVHQGLSHVESLLQTWLKCVNTPASKWNEFIPFVFFWEKSGFFLSVERCKSCIIPLWPRTRAWDPDPSPQSLKLKHGWIDAIRPLANLSFVYRRLSSQPNPLLDPLDSLSSCNRSRSREGTMPRQIGPNGSEAFGPEWDESGIQNDFIDWSPSKKDALRSAPQKACHWLSRPSEGHLS